MHPVCRIHWTALDAFSFALPTRFPFLTHLVLWVGSIRCRTTSRIGLLIFLICNWWFVDFIMNSLFIALVSLPQEFDFSAFFTSVQMSMKSS